MSSTIHNLKNLQQHNKDKIKDRPLIRALKSKTSKCDKRGSIQAIAMQLTKASKTSTARRLPIHTNKVRGQPNDH